MCLLCLLLSDDLASVELDEHGAVSFDLFNGHGKAEVVQKQELKFEVVELWKRKATDLCAMLVEV